MVEVTLIAVALVVSVVALSKASFDHFSLKKQNKELEIRARRAEALLREKALMASELAHEIKNPITAILCSADALHLLVAPRLEDSHRKCLEYIREYGNDLLRLVGDFLDLNQAEGGYLKSKPEEVLLKKTCDSVIGLLQSNAQRKRITVKTYFTSDNLTALVDPKHLKQVLFNIVHNAIKYTHPGGEIHLVVKDNFPHRFLSVSVKDNGCGISPQRLKAIFDPYEREESGFSQQDHSWGLGLAVCKNFVESWGGVIKVESQESIGSCFEFTLPASEVITRAESSSFTRVMSGALQAGRPLEGQSFLLVNQDEGSRVSISQLLEAWGGMVDQVEQASDAIAALSERKYNAVMVDESKNQSDRYSTTKALKENARDLKIPIIVATNNEESSEEAKEAGADKCLNKPLNGEVILQSLLGSERIIGKN